MFFCQKYEKILLQIIVLVFLNHFDVLVSKINFKKYKYIILMFFQAKSTLKSHYYHAPRHLLNWVKITATCKSSNLNAKKMKPFFNSHHTKP